MTYALFLGCKIPASLPAYEQSTRAVLGHVGVALADLDFTCCGYPARSYGRDAFVVAALRNLALAERAGHDVLTPCTCCFGTLRHAVRIAHEDAGVRARAARALADDGLAWSGTVGVVHLLQVLAHEVGVEALAGAVRAPRSTMRVAAQYGCHALRPGDVTGIDNPAAPTLFEGLIRATGATPVDWSRRLDCCGDPLHEANPPVASHMTRAKLADAAAAGADAVCTACPHCHLRFEAARAAAPAPAVPALLYTQLLGLAMGLAPASLGIPPTGSRPIGGPTDGGCAPAMPTS